MATKAEITKLYQDILGRAPDEAGLNYWLNSGQSLDSIRNAFSQTPEAIALRQQTKQTQSQTASPTSFNTLVDQIYQQQLGRTPDPEGAAYWAGQLASGKSVAEVTAGINRSNEGANLDTQYITSLYRQNLARNPEQEGFQYWLSRAQADGLTTDELKDILVNQGAVKEQTERNILGQTFTQMQLPDLEADPWAGRYATQSIYDIPTNEADRINISYINGIPVQFVNPVTQQAIISNYGQDAWNAVAGEETFSKDRVTEAINRAVQSGSMTNQEKNTLLQSLTGVTDPAQVRQILGIPQGAVIVDPKYGQQIGEDDNLQKALDEAALRQAVLTANDTGYYQTSDVLGQAYQAAGLDFPFMTNTYNANTMMTQADKLTPSNLSSKLNDFFKQIQGNFGGIQDVQTPQSGQYYSEAGLQPGFTPFGTEGTTFRSGVAGYVPQSQLPTGFQFGAPPVNATFQQYRPGAFQPAGVTTGGFITGYNTNGTPIYSTYANPNVNVGGATSALNPFTQVQAGAIGDLQAQLDAINAAAAAAANQSAGGG